MMFPANVYAAKDVPGNFNLVSGKSDKINLEQILIWLNN
jgi:hypothetical protein